jgi:hypothetical protein
MQCPHGDRNGMFFSRLFRGKEGSRQYIFTPVWHKNNNTLFFRGGVSEDRVTHFLTNKKTH